LSTTLAESSLAAFFWRFEPARPADALAEAQAMSKALKKQGWNFVGPTRAHAFMQAAGLVNDHHPECFCRAICEKARKAFRRPK
jgi:DNA-3-methyladenine glycosylase I